jgi:hypothetical protein
VRGWEDHLDHDRAAAWIASARPVRSTTPLRQADAYSIAKSCGLEFEFLHILWRHNHGGAKDDLSVLTDRVITKPAGGEGLALLTGDLALSASLGRVIGQISQILHIPPNILGTPPL